MDSASQGPRFTLDSPRVFQDGQNHKGKTVSHWVTPIDSAFCTPQCIASPRPSRRVSPLAALGPLGLTAVADREASARCKHLHTQGRPPR